MRYMNGVNDMKINGEYPDVEYGKPGEWHIVREINSGSFGTVYEIEKEGKYRSALKVIRVLNSKSEQKAIREKRSSEESLKKYLEKLKGDIKKEIDLMWQLRGESNIVSLEDFETRENEDGIGWQVMIRMELLMPLDEYMKKHIMSRADVLRLGIQICRALEICQEKDIIHRDIKPSNIFISDRGVFKLGDFGIARIIDAHNSELDMTGMAGTLSYMAPEVFRNQRNYGFDVDMYALGIVMYELLNEGRLPFQDSDSRSNAVTVRVEGGKTIPRLPGDDTQLSDVILKACSFRPEDRYRSAGLMRKHLEMISRGETINDWDSASTGAINDWDSVEPAGTIRRLMDDFEKTVKRFLQEDSLDGESGTIKKTSGGSPSGSGSGTDDLQPVSSRSFRKRKIALLVVVILAMAGAVYLAGIIKPVPTPPLTSTETSETSTNEPTTKDGSGLEDLIEQKNFVAAYSEIQERTRKGENLDSVIYSFVRACELESEYKRAVAVMRMLSDQVADNADFYRETVKWFYGHDNGEFARQILTDLRNKGPEGEKLANEISSGYDDDNKETDD